MVDHSRILQVSFALFFVRVKKIQSHKIGNSIFYCSHCRNRCRRRRRRSIRRIIGSIRLIIIVIADSAPRRRRRRRSIRRIIPTLRLDTYDARISIRTSESINANRGVARVDVQALFMTKSVDVESILVATESVFGGSHFSAMSSAGCGGEDDIVSTKITENSICSSDTQMEGKCPFLDLTNSPLNRTRGLNESIIRLIMS